MKTSHLLALLSTSFIPVTACTVTPTATGGLSAPVATTTAAKSAFPVLSASDKKKIGNKIWQNESAGKVSGLTAWNVGEEFPSMGIGHFIWYPKNFKGPYTESFPAFVRYAQARNANIPVWVVQSPHCPWSSRSAFNAAKNGAQLASLRTFLANNVPLQTDFILAKSQAALGKILAAAPANQREMIRQNYAKVATTSNGAYALIDYVNFKGEGINLTERYKGQGWGLMQVLANMRAVGSGQAAAKEFSSSAKRMLGRRIQNSNPSRGESRWQAGWFNRCDTYSRPL